MWKACLTEKSKHASSKLKIKIPDGEAASVIGNLSFWPPVNLVYWVCREYRICLVKKRYCFMFQENSIIPYQIHNES